MNVAFYITGIILQVLSFAAVLTICIKYNNLRKRINENYTDYVNGNLVLRVFKNEFEYIAFKDLKQSKILDSGSLSVGYRWVMFEK